MDYDIWKDKWIAIVDKANGDYTSLIEEERIWYNVRCLIDAVDNGGIISFFYNSGADNMSETLEDLNKIKAKEIIKMIERVNKLFPNGKPSKDIDVRNEVIGSWEDGKYEAIFEKIDSKFYEIEEKLEKKIEPIIDKLLKE